MSQCAGRGDIRLRWPRRPLAAVCGVAGAGDGRDDPGPDADHSSNAVDCRVGDVDVVCGVDGNCRRASSTRVARPPGHQRPEAGRRRCRRTSLYRRPCRRRYCGVTRSRHPVLSTAHFALTYPSLHAVAGDSCLRRDSSCTPVTGLSWSSAPGQNRVEIGGGAQEDIGSLFQVDMNCDQRPGTARAGRVERTEQSQPSASGSRRPGSRRPATPRLSPALTGQSVAGRLVAGMAPGDVFDGRAWAELRQRAKHQNADQVAGDAQVRFIETPCSAIVGPPT